MLSLSQATKIVESKVNNSKKICNGSQISQYYLKQTTKCQSNVKKREQNVALERGEDCDFQR